MANYVQKFHFSCWGWVGVGGGGGGGEDNNKCCKSLNSLKNFKGNWMRVSQGILT